MNKIQLCNRNYLLLGEITFKKKLAHIDFTLKGIVHFEMNEYRSKYEFFVFALL